jgi:hypothetical protein
MKTDQRLILFLSLSIIIVACSPTTQLRKSWSDPSLAQNPVEPFKKVLIMVNSKNEANRIASEDKLVSLMKNGNAIPSYTYVTRADTSQKELVERLIKDGFDGAITLRVKAVVQTKTKTTSNPGTSYQSWYGYGPYGGYSYGVTITPGARQDNSTGNVDVNSFKDYIIETNIYSLERKMLLWSGVTASMGAKKIDPAMVGIVNTIRKELNKKGFIKK